MAFRTAHAALAHAAAGDELWVAAGTYRGRVDVPAGVALYGGFAGNETVRSGRDWARNKSVIDWLEWGDGAELFNERFGSAVTLGRGSRVDGFTVANGWHSHGAGVYAGAPEALIANNVIVRNRSSGLLSSAVLADRTATLNVSYDFFLRTANDLLHMQFPFGATNIPVAQYGPAVHRLLQVAANVYDAARSNSFPTVFRPQFATTPDGPVISGYYEDNSATNVNEWLAANPYGIPMIIGARKGMPNFNELVLETTVFATRRLELRRATTNSAPYQTNEMYIVGISNAIGLELWNSYTQAFGHDVQVMIGSTWSYQLSASGGVFASTSSFTGVVTNFPAGTWAGVAYPHSIHPANVPSFKIPLFKRETVLPLSAIGLNYIQTPPHSFEPSSGFIDPDWRLSVSNRLIVVISSDSKILDLAILPRLTNQMALSDYLLKPMAGFRLGEGPIGTCWSTNRRSAETFTPTDGIQRQLDISLGQVPLAPSEWVAFNYEAAGDRNSSISNFARFVFPNRGGNSNLQQIAPFSPTRKAVISSRWEANDPLIHTLPEHLKALTNNFFTELVRPFTNPPLTNQTLGNFNWRYSPWGGRPGRSPTADDVDGRIKDRGAWYPDTFEFPDGNEVNLDWLDRFHRGTPWQTLYFDRDAAPMNDWVRQSLDPGTHPTNDWKIIDYLRRQFSYTGSPNPTRVVNNTIVENDGGIWISTNASASLINNAVASNGSGIVDEGATFAEMNHNCVSCSPQLATDFSPVATSPLIDAGNNAVLAWIERPVYGDRVDIGAIEFGPAGVPVLTFQHGSARGYEVALRGFEGQSYVIEASTNLVEWTAVATNGAAMDILIFSDAMRTNVSHRFYRAKVANHPN